VLLAQGGFVMVLGVQLVFAACSALAAGSAPAAMVELFPTRTRYSGIALGFNVASMVSGLTPLIATWLMRNTGQVLSPAIYLMAIAAIGAAAVLCIDDRSPRSLR